MGLKRQRDPWEKPGLPAPVGTLAGGAALLLLLLAAGFTSWYTVAPEEQAVVLRFGRHVATNPPGLHFKLPLGIDRVEKVPVTEVRKLEFGFRTTRTAVRSEYADTDEEIRLMLTGDLNIASVEWVVQYRIKNAEQWAFSVKEREQTLRDLSESCMRDVIGDHTITEVLTEKRVDIATQCAEQLQAALDAYAMGVHVSSVQLQNVNPPPPVQDSFNAVNAAQQERSRLENEAMQEYNRIIPLARGEARRRLEEAEGYAVERVNEAKGDVARFDQLLAVYRASPEVTRRRLWLEALAEVLPRVARVVVAEGGGGDVLKLLPLQEGLTPMAGGAR